MNRQQRISLIRVAGIALLVLMNFRMAYGATVTFDSVASAGNPTITALSTEGFDFTSSHFHTVDMPAICAFGGCVSNGTIYIAEEAGGAGSPISMAKTDGMPFNLIGFDSAEMFLNGADAASSGLPNATTLNVVGALQGGGFVNASFQLDGIKDGVGGAPDFQSFALPATFTNLLSATFSGSLAVGGAGAFSLDNIVTLMVQVPVPVAVWTGVAMLGGLGVVGAVRGGRQAA